MTKGDITTKALQQFKQHGIKSVSMNDIARGLGMSKKTLYTHFADKEDLLISCLDEALQILDVHARAVKESTTDPVKALLGIYQLVVDDLFGYCSAFMYDARRLYYTSDRNTLFKQQLDEAFILPLLQEAREQELLHPDVEPVMFSTVIYYMIEGFIFDSSIAKKQDKEFIFRHIILLPVRGILAEKYTEQYGELTW
ncbi:MAG: TetR/AcrR family transcriptional regulator [Chitinophagaceae bacterium]